jgi:hypothetical protein
LTGKTIHKEKMFVDNKEISGCSECSDAHRKVFLCDEDRLKVLVFAPLPKSVFSDFEAGKTYWVEITEVSE